MNTNKRLQDAITQWKEVLPHKNILNGSEASATYGQTTFGNDRKVIAAIIFNEIEEIVNAVKIAYQFKIPVYPISTGNNWGYGSAAPVENNCVVFDLSKLDKIEVYDANLGIFSIQPGVTFQKLFEYLESNKYSFFVPNVGSGPTCSVLGNIMERGFGVTPFIDHFQMVTSFKAVLPNGQLYERPFSTLGCDLIDAVYKWGVGPYLDGIFTQGAFGIIYNATICLKPISPEIKLISFDCTHNQLASLINCLEKVTLEYHSYLSGIKIINSRQSLATIIKYPQKLREDNKIITTKNLNALCKHYGIPYDWHGIVAIYGNNQLSNFILKDIKNKIIKYTKKIDIYSYGRIKKLNSIIKQFPIIKKSNLFKKSQLLENMFDGFKGKPVIPPTLNLAYWMKEINIYNLEKPNPQKDGCGFIWFTPLLPFKGEQVIKIIAITESICEKNGIEPLIALNTLSPYCLDLLLPLIFDKKNSNLAERARKCYLELFEACKAEGSIPYRMNIDNMSLITSLESGFWELIDGIKKAIDPHNIMSPGRYNRITPSKIN